MEDCAFNIENFVGESAKEFRNIDVRLTKIEATLPHLATKADLTNLRTDLMAEMSGLRTDMKVEMSSLKANIASVETKLIKWFIGSVIAISALIIASASVIVTILQRFL